MTVQTLISEAGLDMSKWPTEHHYRIVGRAEPEKRNQRGKSAEKENTESSVAARNGIADGGNSLRESHSYLGAQFRRFRSRLGPPKTITAMAARLARLVYRMLKYGEEYVDKGTAQYEEKFRQQKLKMITKQAAEHGLALVPMVNPA